MSIPTVSDISRVTPPPAPYVAPRRAAPEADATAAPAAAAPGAPAVIDIEVEIGRHQGAKADVYQFVDADTGERITQFPTEQVLNLVAQILRRLEIEGQQ